MSEDYRFDEVINIELKRDEAIVLAAFLSRELYTKDETKLRTSFIHPAEEHSLHAVLQELWRSTDEIDQIAGIINIAREHLLKRFT